MEIEVKPWDKFRGWKDKNRIKQWLKNVADFSEQKFRRHHTRGPHTGRKYPSLPNRSSAPGEFPAKQSGRLMASLRSRAVGTKEARIGTGMFYSKFLAEGTTKMKKRKMSKEALLEGGIHAKPYSRGWAKWKRS